MTCIDDTLTCIDGTLTCIDDAFFLIDDALTLIDGTSTLIDDTSTSIDGTSTSIDGTSTLIDDALTSIDDTSTSIDDTSTSGPVKSESIAAISMRYLLALLMLLACSAYSPGGEYKIVAYVPNWIDLAAFTKRIPFDKVTHLNVAFENPTNDAGDLSFNDADRILIEAAHLHGVKVLVSIGGGSASGDKVLKARYAALLSADHRADFVKRISEYIARHGFDGLDVDLEGPSINADYGAFITELFAALNPQKLLLTAALSKGYGGENVPASVLAHFDFVNIMAYDGKGYWDRNAPGQHSSLEFAKANAEYWLERGLANDKAVLGVPFYGYGFGEAYRKRDYPYAEIVANYPGAELKDKVGDSIWYNGVPTIRAKAAYVRDSGLAGVMIWSLDYDVSGDRSLLDAIHSTLK